ncbi:Uncharacterised protein [Chlamydia trachomatis]|nr:Uncharacterised protein [Chlamydia trachomatis]CRI74305.1 Uncharacterised protein [Chlamydia trachomatis]
MPKPLCLLDLPMLEPPIFSRGTVSPLGNLKQQGK